MIAYDKGAPVRLRDVGKAEDGMEERRSIVRFNGIPAVAMGVQKQSGTNTVAVVNAVKAEIEKINKTLPPGMTLNIAIDQSIFIRRSIEEVQKHLILGSFFAILAVFIFLRNFRTTLISAVALPVSIIATFALIRAFGFTFNNMTMLALTLSVGLLIDDAIIVIENIYRHVEEGMAPREAATFATSEIGLAVMATTFAIVAIFLPVAFMKGIIGRFFLQFALTVVFSVLVSLLVSFTLTPMLASIFLKRITLQRGKPGPRIKPHHRLADGFDRGYKKLEGGYRHVLAFSLNHRVIMLVGALLLFAGSLYMTTFMGKEFVPPEDQGQFLVRLEAPIDYSVDKADELFRPAEKILRKMPEVRAVLYRLGIGGSVNRAIMMTSLIPKSERKKTQMDLKKEIRQKLSRFPGLKVSAEDFSLIGGGQRQVPIQYSVRGRDLAELQTYARQIAGEFSKLPGIVDVDTSLEMGKPELKVYIDRDKAADLGVDVSTVAEAINLLISGETEVTKYKDESRGKRYDLRIRLNPEERRNPDDLSRLYVRSRDGRLVELRNLVRIQEGGGPSVINRVDRQRSISLFASLEGKPLGKAVEELNGIAAKILPARLSSEIPGAGRYHGGILRLPAVRYHSRGGYGLHGPGRPVRELRPSLHGPSGDAPLVHRGLQRAALDGKHDQHLQFHRPHPPDGAGEEKRDPARRLHERPAGTGSSAEGGDPPGRTGPAAADPDDDLRDGLRDAAGRLRRGRGGGNRALRWGSRSSADS